MEAHDMKKVIASYGVSLSLLKFLSSKLKVNGPAYKGARMPEFNASSINESQFNDNLRMKSFQCTIVGAGLVINWTTQEQFTDSEAKELVDEIERAAWYLYYRWLDMSASTSRMPEIVVDVCDRDNISPCYSESFGDCNP